VGGYTSYIDTSYSITCQGYVVFIPQG